MSKRVYTVIMTEPCERCEGIGRVYNPQWTEANAAYDAAVDAAYDAAVAKDTPEEDRWSKEADAGWDAMVDFWHERGYHNEDRWPEEEEPCSECEGAGKIVKEVNLLDALRELKVAFSPIESIREMGSDFEEEYMNAVAERTKLRMKIVAAFDVLQARNRELKDVLVEARRAIATLNKDALGRDTMYGYPYRDELLTRIDVALEKDKLPLPF